MATMKTRATPCSNCTALQARVAELEEEVARLRGRPATGRPPKKRRDARSLLIERACKKLGVSRKLLAEEYLGVDSARLSPTGKFAAQDEERLMAKLRELAGSPAA